MKASFAARGLVYQPCGVIVHEDGTVTAISGCGDSPERVAKVKAINKAKREKKAKRFKDLLEYSQEKVEQQRQIIEKNNQNKILADFLKGKVIYHNVTVLNQGVSVISAYENMINNYSEHTTENVRVLSTGN